ncbi:MAG TPA: hypothetical protein VL096_11550 [Pirellulaceae bacterium]|nr:hypothetical protein [Pirellulaceae bacterium]
MMMRMFCLATLLGSLLVVASHASEAVAPITSGGADAKPAPLRLREGELIELAGRLELSGDRAIFYPHDGQPLRILENLALERVAQVLGETRGPREWVVAGLVTECRGTNYLLISKAVQRSRSVEPAK